MAIMRDGLNTWLKQECADVGDKFIGISKLATAAAHEAIYGDASEYLSATKLRINMMVEQGLIPEIDNSAIVNLLTRASNKNDTSFYMQKISDVLTKLALEATVECQCGKDKPEKLQDLLQEFTGVASGDLTVLERNIKAKIERMLNEVTMKNTGTFGEFRAGTHIKVTSPLYNGITGVITEIGVDEALVAFDKPQYGKEHWFRYGEMKVI